MEVVFLGTGGSYPSKKRNVPAIVVKGYGSGLMLLDCGEGTQRQIMNAGLSFMKINNIFITHLHGDHYLGLQGLLQTMALNNRTNELSIYGPEGIEYIGNFIMKTGSWNPGYKVSFNTIKKDFNNDFGNLIVSVEHGTHLITDFAYKIKEMDRRGSFNKKITEQLNIKGKDFSVLERNGFIVKNNRKIYLNEVTGEIKKGKSIVYTGDTAPSDKIAEFSKNVNLLIHDSTVTSDLEGKANQYGHSSSAQAAMIAKAGNVDKLVLTHISPRYEDTEHMLQEAKNIFPESYIAEDFWRLKV
ncbi:MAG: ribonuclease Z [Candidatus Thermoplasmatota archaeon]|nr:ribonuclease Z [Candidatus Thermoplasmatota archaeon]MCL5962790.1 ribonuclease Z [Candidatus Thermoplasmatota archaeon]